jgi:glycosyltransferase involved in cell wall biosynthesis
MRFSIVVPLHRPTPAFARCMEECLRLNHDDFEVLVVSDRQYPLPADHRIRPLVTASASDTSPAEKRDAALAIATGDIVAFLDDDAFPAPDWLVVAERLFAREEIGAIGGPGLTPAASPLRERVGGAAYESILGSGPLRYRFVPGTPRVVDDYPAYNFMVRRSALEACGGWGTRFYGGEDTRLCESLAAMGVMVHYEPQLVVYHHRRPMFRPHMRQVENVGRHRGNFVRVGSDSSRRAVYFMPLAGAALAVAGVARALKRESPGRVLGVVAFVHLALASLSPAKGIPARALFPVALLAHHASYAYGFVRGLLSGRMER